MGLAGPVGLIHGAPPAQARTQEAVALQLARRNRHIDVVVMGLGDTARVVTQSREGSMWTGRLSGGSDAVLSAGARQMSIPGVGWASIQSAPVGSGFQLVVKGPLGTTLPAPTIRANADKLVIRFTGVLADTNPRQMSRLDLRRPGRVAQSSSAPQLRPRAVAPPLGDMAIGTMVLQNRSYVNVSGPPVTLSLNNAPAKDALMSLARLGGYGFVFVGGDSAVTPAGGDGVTTVTMAFADQTYGRALNSVLLASGLQAKLDGRTLMVGASVSGKTFGPQMSKVYRLNQASASSAADYLASLGAQINKVTISGPTEDGGGGGGSGSSDTGAVATFTDIETYGASTGPLRGLTGTTDSRLGTVTLVGDSQLIAVAEGYLRQIDLRKRQVAVKVEILDISLDNDKTINSSFSSRIGDTFVVSEGGNAHLNFGQYKPSPSSGTGIYSGDSGYLQPGVYETNTEIEPMKRFVTPWVPMQTRVETVDGDGNITYSQEDMIDENGNKIYIRDPDLGAIEESEMIGLDGKKIYEKVNNNERYRQPDNSFYAYLNALIVSSSAKTLAQPTLLVQEGEEAKVVTGESVITGRNTVVTENDAIEYTNTRENAGLELTLKVSKIDDNGFISMNINPQISVPKSAGVQGGIQIFNINKRELNSGSIRLRDRQTLILTGVIQDADRQQVQKWPILGDLPLIGQLFRGSNSSRQKNELVIIVTPSILDDQDGGTFGYGYRPSTREARQLMGPR